jgi:hypothetical protein
VILTHGWYLQALATFPVVHEVNHRTMRLVNGATGYIFTFIGDEQASPHFMRYSGLTGACINAVSFNNFLNEALCDVPFVDRLRHYSKETNWSNGEVVQRGTGGSYGEDGFLRPGFSYRSSIDYLFDKVTEYIESEQDLTNLLSRDWKAKLAASMVPRGLETNEKFRSLLVSIWRKTVFEKALREIQNDGSLRGDTVQSFSYALLDKDGSISSDAFWDGFVEKLDNGAMTDGVQQWCFVAKRVCRVCDEVLDFSAKARLYNERVTSEMFNQPKPVDSVVDDFAVEAQTFATALTFAAAFGAALLAFRLIGQPLTDAAAAILGSFSIVIAFGTMTSTSQSSFIFPCRDMESLLLLPFPPLLSKMYHGTRSETKKPVLYTRIRITLLQSWPFLP